MDTKAIKEMSQRMDYDGLVKVIEENDEDANINAAANEISWVLGSKYSRDGMFERLKNVNQATREKIINALLPIALDARNIAEPSASLSWSAESEALKDKINRFVGVIEALGNYGGNRVIDTLSEVAFKCQSSKIKEELVRALSKSSDPKATQAILFLLGDKSMQGFDNSIAAKALIEMKTPGKLIYDFLISFVDDRTFNFHWVKDLFEYLKATDYLQDSLEKTKLAELLSKYVDSSTSWTAAAAKERLELFNLQPVKEVLLNRLYMLSWYYQGKEGENVARAFYEKIIGEIKQNNNFPFKCPCQIGFIHSSIDEHWAVAVLVRGGAEEGNDTKQNDNLYSWFNICKADPTGTEKTQLRVTHSSVEEILQNHYGTHYTCVENYESQR